MTDRALVEKKLAFIRMSLADLRSARIADIRSDRREERFVEHTLQLAIQEPVGLTPRVRLPRER